MTDKTKKTIKQVLGIFVTLLFIVAWVLIVKYGIEYGKMYIDDALADIEMRNIENHQNLTEQNLSLNKEIEALNEDIANLRNEVLSLNTNIDAFGLEVEALKASIDFIDNTVNNSIVIQGEIGNRILALDQRLQELRDSLDVLLEAPQ
jgi:predicted RNase H-like nuclease (RuvC/YqgF family)